MAGEHLFKQHHQRFSPSQKYVYYSFDNFKHSIRSRNVSFVFCFFWFFRLCDIHTGSYYTRACLSGVTVGILVLLVLCLIFFNTILKNIEYNESVAVKSTTTTTAGKSNERQKSEIFKDDNKIHFKILAPTYTDPAYMPDDESSSSRHDRHYHEHHRHHHHHDNENKHHISEELEQIKRQEAQKREEEKKNQVDQYKQQQQHEQHERQEDGKKFATFFDIKLNNDASEYLKFWQKMGLLSNKQLETNHIGYLRKEIDENSMHHVTSDLKKYIAMMDGDYNPKLKYIYNNQHHLYNMDENYNIYDIDLNNHHHHHKDINNGDNDNNDGWNIKQYNIHTYYQEQKDSSTIYNNNNNNNVYKMIEPKQYFYEKYSKQMKDNLDDIELIFPENDRLLDETFLNLNKFGEIGIDNDWYKYWLKKHDNDDNESERINKLLFDQDESYHQHHSHHFSNININGVKSDLSLLRHNSSTLSSNYLHAHDNANEKQGKSDKFWRLERHCIRRKSSSIFPHWRILWKSNPLSCEQIVDSILIPISKCLDLYGEDCDMLIDSGYFRFVFKHEIPVWMVYGTKDSDNIDEMMPIVVKIIKPKFFGKIGDWLRHARESIMLHYMTEWENDFINDFGPLYSTPNNYEQRAFRFVPEIGHCVWPTWISVMPYYDLNLETFIMNGQTQNMTLVQAIDLCLQVLSGLQILHTIKGGPLVHADIQPRQFMIQFLNKNNKNKKSKSRVNNFNVLINDFNTGLFKEYYFESDWLDDKDDNNDNSDCNAIIPSFYCMANNHGHWRAPEQMYSDPWDEKSDIWSIGLVLWSIFSFNKPFYNVNYQQVKPMIHDQYLRPNMPYNMPPYIKDIIRQCLIQDSRKRPNINYIIQSFQYFAKNIQMLSQGKHQWTLFKLRKEKIWKETNWPNLDVEQRSSVLKWLDIS